VQPRRANDWRRRTVAQNRQRQGHVRVLPDFLPEFRVERNRLSVGGEDHVAWLETSLRSWLAVADRNQMRMDVRQHADVADLEAALLIGDGSHAVGDFGPLPQAPALDVILPALA